MTEVMLKVVTPTVSLSSSLGTGIGKTACVTHVDLATRCIYMVTVPTDGLNDWDGSGCYETIEGHTLRWLLPVLASSYLPL